MGIPVTRDVSYSETSHSQSLQDKGALEPPLTLGESTVGTDDDVMRALAAHDEAVDRCAWPIWVGAEPTYTNRSSEALEWLFDALGEDKRRRAERMVVRLARAHEGAAVLRSVGRQYRGEPAPRWSLGLYARRDGTPLWHGPPDPFLAEAPSSPKPDALAATLTEVLRASRFAAAIVDAPLSDRVVFRTDGGVPPTSRDAEPLLGRPSLHGEGVEVADSLAQSGIYLVACATQDGVLRVELPGIQEVDLFERLLDALSTAAIEIGAPALNPGRLSTACGRDGGLDNRHAGSGRDRGQHGARRARHGFATPTASA